MCGICAILTILPANGDKAEDGAKADCCSNNCENHKLIEEQIQSGRIHHRGPDIQNLTHRSVGPNLRATLYGCTLHFRGVLTPQPLVDKQGNFLLWNGEIFGGVDVFDQNDGATLLDRLQKCSTVESILSLFSTIRGPWAMVYYQAQTGSLWFGRDVFGRRSLLLHTSHDGQSIGLSSVQLKDLKPWVELPAKGIYRLNCLPPGPTFNFSSQLTLYPWLPRETARPASFSVNIVPNPGAKSTTSLDIGENTTIPLKHGQHGVISNIAPFNKDCTELELPQDIGDCAASASSESNMDIMKIASSESIHLADKLIEVLGEAVKVRVREQADVCDLCLKERMKTYNSQCHGKSQNTSPITAPDQSSGIVLNGLASVRLEDGDSRQTGDKPGPVKPGCGHARTAVLFSGGIDSLVLTALADRYVPAGEPIDLLNVAFKQKPAATSGKAKKGSQREEGQGREEASSGSYNVPDRVTGRDGVKLLNPDRPWNFIEVNVTMEELQKARSEHVQELVYPLQTVLDDSIGCAIWFAARGRGEVVMGCGESETRRPYASTARVVLVGMGADEQLAGYSRHRVKYNTGGVQGLVEEIQMEIERISARNLGRDDRIISDHGKESRFPFLNENVVSFLNSLPIRDKADLRLPRGVGEKFLLRVAAVKLGLGPSATLPKRAIQFGSRIAKMENRKEKASDVCGRLGAS